MHPDSGGCEGKELWFDVISRMGCTTRIIGTSLHNLSHQMQCSKEEILANTALFHQRIGFWGFQSHVLLLPYHEALV